MSITSEVLNRLASEESAKCVVIVVEEKMKSGEKLDEILATYKSVAFIIFGARNITGTLLIQAGEMCPHHFMLFDNVIDALQFLNTQEKNLRSPRL